MAKCQTKKWKIAKVAKNIDQFDLIDLWKNTILKEIKLRKDFIKDLQSFKNWYFTWLKANELDDKVQIIWKEYSSLENKTEEQKDWLQELKRAQITIKENDVDIYPDEIIRANEKKVRKYIESPELKKYKIKIIRDYLEGAEHYLNEQNSIINKEIGGIEALSDIYDAVRDDMCPESIYDSKGNVFRGVKWVDLATHKDPNVRRDAYDSYFDAVRKHRYALAAIMYYVVVRMNQAAKLRHYKNEEAWKADAYYELSLKDYYYIIDQCEKFAPINIKYRKANSKLIADAYGMDSYEPWDSAIAIKDTFEKATINDCRKVVYDSLGCLGESYANEIKELFKKKIDSWDGVDSSNTGGYCYSGTPSLDENPIKIKWDGTLDGAVTLSHELGHNIKALLTRRHNEVNNSTQFICSELPGIVNQFITMFYLIDKYKNEKKPNLLYGVYNELFYYYTTLVCYYGFKMQFHDTFVNHYMSNKKINASIIERMFIDIKKDYYGLNATEYKKQLNKPHYQNEKLKAYESFIYDDTHFGQNTLGYYLGAIVGLVVAYKIYHGDVELLKKYQVFLKAGNGVKPIKIYKLLGIDILKPQIYTESKQLINKLLNDFIKILKVK